MMHDDRNSIMRLEGMTRKVGTVTEFPTQTAWSLQTKSRCLK